MRAKTGGDAAADVSRCTGERDFHGHFRSAAALAMRWEFAMVVKVMDVAGTLGSTDESTI
jgi:hypothetical protein